MAQITSSTPITHVCKNGTEFSSDRADLKNGLQIARSIHRLTDEEGCLNDFMEFGAWHAMEVWPHLTEGFYGYGLVKLSAKPLETNHE